MPDEMTREQFTKVCTAIAQAAQLLPALDYESARALALRVEEAVEAQEGTGAYSPLTLQRVRELAELIIAAGVFKAAADRVAHLGVSPQEIPLEEVISADDRPAALRAADRAQAPRPGPGEDPGS
jgi:hypothetical protein